MDRPEPPTHLTTKFYSAWLSLWVERCSTSFHWLIWWLTGFICLALFNFSGLILSSVFWTGAIILFAWGYRRFNAPTRTEIQGRLERDSRILHRPLRSQSDEPSTRLTREGIELWTLEQTRKFSQLRFIRWITPRLNLSQRDPYALRIATVLVLFLGVVISGPATGDKLREAFLPFMPNLQTDTERSLKIVITPPSYTRKPQLIITGRVSSPVNVPEGSKVRVLMQSWVGHINLVIGEQIIPLLKEGKTDAYTAEASVTNADAIKIKQFGLPRLTIPITYIKDTPPSITLKADPEVVMNGQLRLPLTITDDYGLKLIRVRAILSPLEKSHPLGTSVFEEQSVVAISDGKPVDINPKFDLTGHPWAGYPVSLLIEGEDYAGQTATAEPIEMVLPQRPFRHPVAQEIIATRKILIRNGEQAAGAMALQLAQILSRPGRYDWDYVVTLALRSSLSRLAYDPTQPSTESVIGTLWPTALRLEDGNLTTTQTDLRKALENLQRAIQEKKSPEDIAQLMQDFKEALANHLMAMQKEMQKRAQNGELMMLPPDMMTQMFDPSMINDFLDQLANEMMNGDLDEAMKKLESLQKMSDMLDPSMAQPMPEDVKQMMKAMQDLQKVIDAQQALLDKTRAKKDSNSQGESAEQGQISNNLGEMKDKAGGKVPDSIGKAEGAMGQSKSELEGNNPDGSVPHQQEALDQLRQGRKEMQKSMQERMQQMMGMSMGIMPGSRDPLGRNSKQENGRDMFNDTVKIPNGAERKKSDEILKTIRERSSDLSRPQAEREYYQRLLRQW